MAPTHKFGVSEALACNATACGIKKSGALPCGRTSRLAVLVRPVGRRDYSIGLLSRMAKADVVDVQHAGAARFRIGLVAYADR